MSLSHTSNKQKIHQTRISNVIAFVCPFGLRDSHGDIEFIDEIDLGKTLFRSRVSTALFESVRGSFFLCTGLILCGFSSSITLKSKSLSLWSIPWHSFERKRTTVNKIDFKSCMRSITIHWYSKTYLLHIPYVILLFLLVFLQSCSFAMISVRPNDPVLRLYLVLAVLQYCIDCSLSTLYHEFIQYLLMLRLEICLR